MEEKKEENEIRIYNSLPETTPRNYQLHLVYPKTPLYVVEGLPRQKGLDCGYWSFFSTFIVFLTPESLDMISELKESMNNKFKTFKEFDTDCLKVAHNKLKKK